MRLRLKTTGFSHAGWLEEMVREKITRPLLRRARGLLLLESPLDVELAKITRHHREGRIWKCEINLPLPGAKKTIFVEAVEETLENAVDRAREELEEEVSKWKGRRAAEALKTSRRLKERSRPGQ